MVSWPPPSLFEACNDPGMQGTPLEILTRMWCVWCEGGRYRPLPNAVVIAACGIEDVTASRSLDYIAEMGYIEEGPKGPRGVRTFRVLTTRAVRAA